MSLSFFKSNGKIEIKDKISAVEILKYGEAIKRRYNYMVSTINYEITRNIYYYVPSMPSIEIIGVDILEKKIYLKTDTIYKTIVAIVDDDEIRIITPERFDEEYVEGKVLLAAISDILLKYFDLCLEFKSFKTDITKAKCINKDFELEISPTGIFLCVESKKGFSKFCSILYEHYKKENGEIISATEEEKKLLNSLYFYVEDCPEWVKEEHKKNKASKRKSKCKLLRIVKSYLGGLS